MNAAELFLERSRSLMRGQHVSGRTLGGSRLSVSIATRANHEVGWGLGFYPSWRLDEGGRLVASSQQLNDARFPEAWHQAGEPTRRLFQRVLEDLIWDRHSGLLTAIFDAGLELRALGADPGEAASWYIRDLSTHWLLTGSADGLRVGPDA